MFRQIKWGWGVSGYHPYGIYFFRKYKICSNRKKGQTGNWLQLPNLPQQILIPEG